MPIETHQLVRKIISDSRLKARLVYKDNYDAEQEMSDKGGYWREYDLKMAKFYEYNFHQYLKLLGFKNIIELVEHLEKELLDYNSTLSEDEPHIKLLDIMSSSGSLARPLQGLYKPDQIQGEKEYMKLYATNTEKLLQSADTLTILDYRDPEVEEEDNANGIAVHEGNISLNKTWEQFSGKKYNLITFRPEGGIEDNLSGLYILTKIIYKSYKLLEDNGVMLIDYNYASKKVGPLMQIYLRFLSELGFDILYTNIGFYLKKRPWNPAILPLPSDTLLEEMVERANLIEPSKMQKLVELLKRIFSRGDVYTPEEQREPVEQ